MRRCVRCGREWTDLSPPGFQEVCPQCDVYLHSCINCRLYNRRADRCSSVTAECTGDREHYNYCEEYQMAQIQLPKTVVQPDPKAKWRALFGEK